MTESEKRQAVIAQAIEWMGADEGGDLHRGIIDTYNSIFPLPAGYHMTYTDPWCAAFVSAVGWCAGMEGIILPECSCDRMIALYKAAGRWVEDDNYTPTPGDIIMYDWQDSGDGDNTGSADHVGIVETVNCGSMTVIEGNISDTVGRRIIGVGSKNIRGYCVPDYSGACDAAPAHTAKPKTVPTYYYKLSLPLLKLGMEHSSVQTVKTLLESCGLYSGDCDRAYNGEAVEAVISFQHFKGLEADGEVGGLTWAALLGVR